MGAPTYHAGVSTPPADSLPALYERLGARLHRQALAVVACPAAAEDLVHEAFSRLIAREEGLGVIDRIDGYLFRTVRNLALNHLRRRETDAKAQAKLRESLLLTGPEPDPLEARDEAVRVSRALAGCRSCSARRSCCGSTAG